MKKSLVLFSAIGLAMLAGAPARADDSSHPWNDEVGQWFVAPFIGYAWLDSSRLLDDNLYWGASLGKHLSEDWSAQISGYTGDYDNNGQKDPSWNWPASFDATLSGVMLDLMRVFNRSGTISPYVLGGIGYQNDNYVGLEGEADVTASLGLGLMWDVYRNGDGSRTVQVRPEVRQRWDFATGDTLSDTLVQVGIGLGWGPPRPAPVVAEAPPRRRPRRPRPPSAVTRMATAFATLTTSARTPRPARRSTRSVARARRSSRCFSISTSPSCAPSRSPSSSAS